MCTIYCTACLFVCVCVCVFFLEKHCFNIDVQFTAGGLHSSAFPWQIAASRHCMATSCSQDNVLLLTFFPLLSVLSLCRAVRSSLPSRWPQPLSPFAVLTARWWGPQICMRCSVLCCRTLMREVKQSRWSSSASSKRPAASLRVHPLSAATTGMVFTLAIFTDAVLYFTQKFLYSL